MNLITVFLHLCLSKYSINKNKRAVVGVPANVYAEVAVVTDYSVYLAHQTYINSTNTTLVILSIKIYFASIIYAVSVTLFSMIYSFILLIYYYFIILITRQISDTKIH